MLIDKGPFRRASLKHYLSTMNKPNPNCLFDDHVAEILEQQGFTWKEDPRSIYDPQQLYTALERYATDWTHFETVDEHLSFGFRKAFKIFAKPKDERFLTPLTDQEVVTKALKLNKSAGLPLMSKKRDSLIYAFDREKQVRVKSKAPNPCVAYKRTQQGNKTRLVWGYPLEMTIIEARFARPLINRFLNMRTPMAFGVTKCNLGSYIHRYIKDVPGTVVALDYSKFDSTLSKTMIKQAFRILETWFTTQDLEEWGFSSAVGFFIKTPIVMPNGHLYGGKEHGVPSGSYFTQMIDSIVNVALCYALAHKFKFNLKDKALFVLGDDVLMNVDGNVNLEAWGLYLNKFGLNLNLKKTKLNELHFLGAYWDKGKPDVPIQELVNKAVFPETFRNYLGKPNKGSRDVLSSYAANYLSGFYLIPNSATNIRSTDLGCSDEVDPSYLSGSDRFLLEESTLSPANSKGLLNISTLSIRILL